MSDTRGWTRALQPLLAKATLAALEAAGGTMRVRELLLEVAKRVSLELIDLDRFLSLWVENYEKLSEDDKGLLRLKKVYFLAPE